MTHRSVAFSFLLECIKVGHRDDQLGCLCFLPGNSGRNSTKQLDLRDLNSKFDIINQQCKPWIDTRVLWCLTLTLAVNCMALCLKSTTDFSSIMLLIYSLQARTLHQTSFTILAIKKKHVYLMDRDRRPFLKNWIHWWIWRLSYLSRDIFISWKKSEFKFICGGRLQDMLVMNISKCLVKTESEFSWL